jgi:cyclopropane fatty-acyl-phospholipid synthase-like methyltransferase
VPEFGKPWSAACERNREPILAVLREHFADRRQVLEIGSGTGQHAAFFGKALPNLVWQASDRSENLPGIQAWIADAALPNVPPPIRFDVNGRWPDRLFDAVFSANTLHIMGWNEVQAFFAGLPSILNEDAKLVVYGPFNYQGQFTSDNNARFDASLKSQASHMGIRDFEKVNELAQTAGLQLVEDREMPANNRCLVWQRLQPAQR